MKTIWKISLSAIAAGLLLMGIGFMTGAERGGVDCDNGPKLVRQRDVKVMQDTFSGIRNINLDVDFGDIEFVAADRYAIELRGYEDEWEWNLSGDTLSVTQSSREQNRFMIFSFNSGEVLQRKATIYLPSDAHLGRAGIYSGSGDVTAGGFAAADTIIESGFGTVDLFDLTTDALYANLGSGDFTGTNLSAGSVTFSSGFGSGKFEAVTASRFSADSGSGDLNFTTRLEEAIEKAQIVFIAVGTPMGEDGSADLGAVLAVADRIGTLMQSEKPPARVDILTFTMA